MGLPEDILNKIGDVAKGQKEIKQKLLDYELDFFGRLKELPYLGQVIRALTRPILTWYIALLFGVGIVLYWIYVWKFHDPIPEFIPKALVDAFKWVIGFWFSWRGVQETAKILTKTSKLGRKESKEERKAEKQRRKAERKNQG